MIGFCPRLPHLFGDNDLSVGKSYGTINWICENGGPSGVAFGSGWNDIVFSRNTFRSAANAAFSRHRSDLALVCRFLFVRIWSGREAVLTFVRNG